MTIQVGFIGLGLMGRPMAANLLKKDFGVTVWNRTASKADPLKARGAKVAATPREAAESADVLITIVSDPPAVEEVLWGAQGALAGLRRGSVLVESSTISPELERRIATACAAQGVECLDAPVTGGTWGAEKGELVMMVGGDAATLKRVEPVLGAMAKRWFLVGSHGAGQTAKLAMNLLLALEVEALAEALMLATAGGVSGEKFIEIMQSSMSRSPVLDIKAPMLLERSYAPSFPLRLMTKDLRLALDLAEQLKISLPVGKAGRDLYSDVLKNAQEDLDFAAVGRYWDKAKSSAK